MPTIAGAIAWPVCVLIFALSALFMFKEKISAVIDRARGGKAGGFSLDLDPMAQPIQVTPGATRQPPQIPTATAKTSSELGISDDVLREFESPSVIEIEDRIHAELDKRKLLPVPGARDGAFKLLSRSLAKLILHSQYESIYAVIFGTQINLIAHINGQNETGVSGKMLREYYERKQAEFPKLKDYSFESYIAYLINSVLLKKDGEAYKVTVKGRDFLQYIAATGKPFNKDL